MANLTNGRDTRAKQILRSVDIPVKASTVIMDGSIVCVVGGYAAPAADGAGNLVMGIADWKVDNSAGANGDKHVRVRQGDFHLDNAASGTIAQADVGKLCYPTDDHTVSKTAGANGTAAGKILEIDADGGVWVAVIP